MERSYYRIAFHNIIFYFVLLFILKIQCGKNQKYSKYLSIICVKRLLAIILLMISDILCTH